MSVDIILKVSISRCGDMRYANEAPQADSSLRVVVGCTDLRSLGGSLASVQQLACVSVSAVSLDRGWSLCCVMLCHGAAEG